MKYSSSFGFIVHLDLYYTLRNVSLRNKTEDLITVSKSRFLRSEIHFINIFFVRYVPTNDAMRFNGVHAQKTYHPDGRITASTTTNLCSNSAYACRGRSIFTPQYLQNASAIDESIYIMQLRVLIHVSTHLIHVMVFFLHRLTFHHYFSSKLQTG